MVRLLNLLSIICAGAASVIALSVALNGAAEQIMASVTARGGMDLYGSDFNSLVNSLIRDGRWNAIAAALAALSTILQVFAFVADRKKGRL